MTIVAILNNLHGYYILNTTEGTFNSKCFFIVRILLQLIVIYISVILITGRDLVWNDLQISESDKVYPRLKIYDGIIVSVGTVICVILIMFARKLIEVKQKT